MSSIENLEKRLNGSRSKILEEMDSFKQDIYFTRIKDSEKYFLMGLYFTQQYDLSQREFKQLYGQTQKMI